MSSDVVIYYSVKPFSLIQDHLDFPDKFNTDSLPEEDIIRFGIDSDGRVICPISLVDLEVGSSCYKVDCCKRVFLYTSLKEWVQKKPICPWCMLHLNQADVLTMIDRIKGYLIRVSDDFVSTFESEEDLGGTFLCSLIINLYT